MFDDSKENHNLKRNTNIPFWDVETLLKIKLRASPNITNIEMFDDHKPKKEH